LRLAARFDAAWDERWSGRIGAQRWAAQIVPDASNARAAIAWARSAGALDTAVTIAATLFQALPRTPHQERMALADLCESFADLVPTPHLRLRALEVAIRPMVHTSQQRSLHLADQALELARQLDRTEPDRWLLYRVLSAWISAAAVVAEPALPALRDALAELAALEDPRWPPHRTTRGAEARRLARAVLGGPEQPAEQLLLTRRALAGMDAEGADTAVIMGTLIDAELECGNVQAAIELGERVLAQMAGSRDEWSRMLVRSNLALGWLAVDNTVRGRELMQAVWPPALQSRLHVLCSDNLALLCALGRRVWRARHRAPPGRGGDPRKGRRHNALGSRRSSVRTVVRGRADAARRGDRSAGVCTGGRIVTRRRPHVGVATFNPVASPPGAAAASPSPSRPDPALRAASCAAIRRRSRPSC
jgi:hypothetical protein